MGRCEGERHHLSARTEAFYPNHLQRSTRLRSTTNHESTARTIASQSFCSNPPFLYHQPKIPNQCHTQREYFVDGWKYRIADFEGAVQCFGGEDKGFEEEVSPSTSTKTKKPNRVKRLGFSYLKQVCISLICSTHTNLHKNTAKIFKKHKKHTFLLIFLTFPSNIQKIIVGL